MANQDLLALLGKPRELQARVEATAWVVGPKVGPSGRQLQAGLVVAVEDAELWSARGKGLPPLEGICLRLELSARSMEELKVAIRAGLSGRPVTLSVGELVAVVGLVAVKPGSTLS